MNFDLINGIDSRQKILLAATHSSATMFLTLSYKQGTMSLTRELSIANQTKVRNFKDFCRIVIACTSSTATRYSHQRLNAKINNFLFTLLNEEVASILIPIP
jgi:hypothetical protein